jgi:hypothetical protein
VTSDVVAPQKCCEWAIVVQWVQLTQKTGLMSSRLNTIEPVSSCSLIGRYPPAVGLQIQAVRCHPMVVTLPSQRRMTTRCSVFSLVPSLPAMWCLDCCLVLFLHSYSLIAFLIISATS